MLTDKEEALKKKCEEKIAELEKECEREIAELGRKSGKERKRIAGENFREVEAGERSTKMPKRWFDLVREKKERRIMYAKKMERCRKILEKLRRKARGDESIHITPEGAEITVVHSICQAYITGREKTQIKSHFDRIESHQEFGVIGKEKQNH